MVAEPHYDMMLRHIYPRALVNTTVDKDIFEGKSLNRHESSISYVGLDLVDFVEQFCQHNSDFDTLFLRMRRRFEDCQTIHCCYMEVYHRLFKNPTTCMRRLRHYVINHVTALIQTFMQIMFLSNGDIVRSEDAEETPPCNIHPTLFTTFGDGGIRVQKSLTSLTWLTRLRHVLLKKIKDVSAPIVLKRNVKQFDASVASHKENMLNWLTDTIDMMEMLQLIVGARLLRGFINDEDGWRYRVEFIRDDSDNAKGLQISPSTIATKLNLDFKLINYNIAQLVIQEAVDCAVGGEVLNDLQFRLFVFTLVERKRINYQEYASTLYMTVETNRSYKYHAKRKAAEAGYYSDKKHLMWW
jgi:hypothetical protein